MKYKSVICKYCNWIQSIGEDEDNFVCEDCLKFQFIEEDFGK